MGAHALGGADDGAQIVGIGDLVTDDDEGVFIPFLGDVQNVLHRAVFLHRAQGHHTLVGVGLAHGVQLPAVGLHHHDALGSGLGGDVPEGLIHLALGDVDLVDGSSGAESLDHGISALDMFIFQLEVFHNFS